MKISLNVPCTMHFDDYHQIYEFVDRINELGGKPKLKFTEIQGESDYGYVALFYVNKQDKAYKSCLKRYKESLK